MGAKIHVLQLTVCVLSLGVCDSERNYFYNSRLRDLALERRSLYLQPKHDVRANSILEPADSKKFEKSLYKKDKDRYKYKYNKIFRKPYKVYESKTTASISSVPAPAPTQQPARAPDTTLNYSMMDHKKRLRQLLVPLPRHIAGPRPTISSAEARVSRKKEAAAPETQFVCPPTLHQDPRRGRNWRAFPDPASSKHYYICLVQKSAQPGDNTDPVRHSCEEGTTFSKESETCEGEDEVTVATTAAATRPTRPPVTSARSRSSRSRIVSKEKQSLFVEFIQFLIRIGMFNKNVVLSMLNNKDLFL